MEFSVLENDVKNYVKDFMSQHDKPALYYHNLVHTKMVVKAVKLIADHYQLSVEDHFVIVAAAWFHDLAYYNGITQGHEKAGAELAAQFLTERAVGQNIISKVESCILATQVAVQPNGLLEQIICDADMFHLGTDDFEERQKLLRKELQTLSSQEITGPEWRDTTIRFLQQQHYHTSYVQTLLNEKKQQNLEKLIRRQEEKRRAALAEQAAVEPHAPEVPKKDKPGETGRGVETMFRITSSNNQRLSDMADNKAQILITVNSIILSAIISLLLRKLDEYSQFTLPTFALLTISVVTIVICILATRPSVPRGIFTQEDIDNKKVNLLFFGNFYAMNFEDYKAGMLSVMADKEFLYGTLIKDVYSQGVVLGKKYKMLRLAYSIFMFGLVCSMIGFVIAVIVSNK